jgi:hypothetical protein
MPVDVTSHPQFGTRMAKFNADLGAASAEGNETRMAQVRQEWTAAQMEMQNDLYAQAEAERERQGRLAKFKTDYPHVPEIAYANIGDLAQAEEVAKQLEATYTSTQPRSTANQSWSPAPGGGGQEPQAADFVDPNEERDLYTGTLPSVQKRMDQISGKVLRSGKAGPEGMQNIEELMHLSMEPFRAGYHRKR